MTAPPYRRMLLLLFSLLLAACTRPGGDIPAPPPTVVVSTAVATAEARSSSPTATNTVASIASTRGATPTGVPIAPITPGTPSTRGTATRSPVTSPSGPGRPLTPPPLIGAEVWERLRRPLQVPTIAAGAPCPQDEGRVVTPAYGPALGDGPAYAVGLDTAGVLRYSGRQEGGWYYQKALFLVGPAYRGPLLIRGRQLDGPDEARFDEGAAPPAELRLLPAAGSAADWRGYPSIVRFRAPGCYAWQLDGEDFSEVVIFQVVQ